MPVTSGNYPARTLFGKLSFDTTGAEVVTYTNKDGQLIYKKVYLESTGSGPLLKVYGITRYVYDDWGRLRYTLPPKAMDAAGSAPSQTLLDNLCYQYQYDTKGRLSGQQFPGQGGFTEMVYDQKDRPVLRRTPNETIANQWEVTYYDKQSRVIGTSLYTNNESRATWQNRFDSYAGATYLGDDIRFYLMTEAGVGYAPGESDIVGNQMMSYYYFDHYDNSFILGGSLSEAATLLDGWETVSHEGAEQPLHSIRSHGLPTGSLTKILVHPNSFDFEVGNWRMSRPYYDDKGRVILSFSGDYYYLFGGVILLLRHRAHSVGTQYDFMNRPLLSKHVMENLQSSDHKKKHTELTFNEHDAITGRLKKTSHKVNHGTWQVQSMYDYDGMGRVRRKILGNYGEVQDYTYNIRGQLTGINGNYAETGEKNNVSRSFGQSLKYDYGFTNKRYDGQISGQVWRGSTVGSTLVKHAYGYGYDASGRMRKADYRQERKVGMVVEAWNKTDIDYTVDNISFDKNGNLLTMDQRAVGYGNPVYMDKLTYNYKNSGQSNQINTIDDDEDGYFELGDFGDNYNMGLGFTYDANGNLTSDPYKNITSITYTHFNKPQTIQLGNGSKICYSYDASGNKVHELAIDPNPFTTNVGKDYVGNFVYHNNSLQYLMHSEGRSVYNNADSSTKEEYFVKDHLGNVRSVVDVYTYPIEEYLATWEVASANLEGLFFDHHDPLRDYRPGSIDPEDAYSARLNGADVDRRVGTALTVKVMAGDEVQFDVNNFYDGYDAINDAPVSSGDMIDEVLNTLVYGSGGLPGGEHDPMNLYGMLNSTNMSAFNSLISSQIDPDKPKAYLNYLLFDEYMQLVPEGSGIFQANGNGSWTQIGTSTPVKIPVNGYFTLFLSNSSKVSGCYNCGDVFFDQLNVQFSKGRLKEETHYYPFGLPISTLSSTAGGSFKDNRHKYQGNEQIKDLDLNWMDFHNRQYDPQIGRFMSIDPLAHSGGQERLSPYAAMGNNPVSMVDPLGLQYIGAQGTPVSSVGPMEYIRMMFPTIGKWLPGNGVLDNSTATFFAGLDARDAGAAAASTAYWEGRRAEWNYILGKAEENGGSYTANGGSVDHVFAGVDVNGNNVYWSNPLQQFLVWSPKNDLGARGIVVAARKGKQSSGNGWFDGIRSALAAGDRWLNNGMKDNLIGRISGPESSWMGAEGFKNKGWPTIKATVGVLGTIVSGGALSIYGASTSVTFAGSLFNSAGFTVGAYNTINDISNGTLPGGNIANDIGVGFDATDFFFGGSPLGALNLMMQIANYQINQSRGTK